MCHSPSTMVTISKCNNHQLSCSMSALQFSDVCSHIVYLPLRYTCSNSFVNDSTKYCNSLLIYKHCVQDNISSPNLSIYKRNATAACDIFGRSKHHLLNNKYIFNTHFIPHFYMICTTSKYVLAKRKHKIIIIISD